MYGIALAKVASWPGRDDPGHRHGFGRAGLASPV
jgi:hypothetical protein